MEETSNVLFSIGPLEVSGSVVTMWILILAGCRRSAELLHRHARKRAL